MGNFNSSLMLNVLVRDFPEVVDRINAKIVESMPKVVLSDTSEIEKIVNQFCKLKKISLESWSNQPGKSRITDERELLLAVIIMFFQPERLNGLCEKRIKTGIVKELSTALNSGKQVISRSISSAISNYKIYPDFKKKVHQTYDHLILSHHGNKN